MAFEMAQLDSRGTKDLYDSHDQSYEVPHQEEAFIHSRPKSRLRWVVLVLCVFLIFGPYYAYGVCCTNTFGYNVIWV